MNQTGNSVLNDLFGKKTYFLAAAVVCIPVFFAAVSYAKATGIHEDEGVGFATCVIFVAGIFAGRYVGMIAGSRAKPAPNYLFFILAVIILAGISWLFFYAQFPFRGKQSLSLLFFWLPFLLISFSAGMLIKLTRSIAQRQIAEAQATAAHSQSELNLLQSQLSPHFLFNTLNNLYGLSITQHEKIPPLLLRLSDLLRYSVYEANETFVPLANEVAYLNNFIEFEKLRIGDKLVLTTDIVSPSGDARIAPMLLIVFVENAFKHSKNTTEEKVYIDIQLRTWENYILFTVKNSRSKEKNEKKSAVDKSSGYGMVNVGKRLDILYPNEHRLDIQQTDSEYKVALQLKIK